MEMDGSDLHFLDKRDEVAVCEFTVTHSRRPLPRLKTLHVGFVFRKEHGGPVSNFGCWG